MQGVKITNCPFCKSKLNLEIFPAQYVVRCKNCREIVGHFDGEDIMLKEGISVA